MKKMKKMKNVKFETIIKVHLIPICKDKALWWSTEDILESQFECCQEIIGLLSYRKEMSYSDAIKLLYQPGNIRYDKSNFVFK